MKKYSSALMFFFSVIFCTHAKAERIGFSDEEWKKIKTEHFDIIFTAKQQDLGLYYATQAEKAYENLATVFLNRPERVVIVVNDTTDISNGYATRIPYAHIMAYAVPIGNHETLSEAGEWGRELITHELTHILQFEPALGVYKFIRPIFGTIIAPNLLMPLWWKEGMAVEMETQFSPQGRTRSHFQDASVRALVLDQKIFDYNISQINEVLPSWPYGSRPYLFGSIFWNSLVNDSNISAVDHIVSRQGQRAPYAIEEPITEVVDKDYEGQYNKALYDIDKNAKLQIEKLKEQPLSTVEYVVMKGQNAYNPRWSAQHKILAYVEQSDTTQKIIFLQEGKERLSFKKAKTDGTFNGFDFHPTQKKVLITKADSLNSKYYISDLFTLDLETEKTEQLTKNQRAREATYSDDGEKIVYISTFDGRTQVKIYDIPTKQITTVASADFKNRYQTPIFWNQNEILVSKRNEIGEQKLYSINLTDKKETLINLNIENVRFLRKKTEAKVPTLYFTSSQNGVNNIYVTIDLKKAVPVTHVPTGIWSFDIDSEHQKIWATNMTSTGFQVGELELKKRSAALPVIENALAKKYNYKEKTEISPLKYDEVDYSAASYLLPQYWIPFVSASSSSKGVYIQAQTSGHDPIHIHEYALQANYDTELEKGGFAGFYLNSSLSVPVKLAATIENQPLGNKDNIVETKSTSLGLLPDMFWLSKHLTFELGVEYQQTNYFSSETQHWGSYLQTTFLDYSQNIFQISPENGWGGYLKYENMKNVKNSKDYNKVLGAVIGYFSPWLPKHHMIMTRVSGLLTFESISSRFGTSNESLFLNSDLILPQFVLRGYIPNQFYGRSLWNVNVEYRFPLMSIEKGTGTYAYYLKRLSAAVVTDGLGVEGGSITEDNNFESRTFNEGFWSSGLELKLETTIGYVFPINIVLGAYQPYSPKYRSSPQAGFSLQLGGF